MANTKRVTADEARDKAEECRKMARKIGNSEYRKMLEEMAETWD